MSFFWYISDAKIDQVLSQDQNIVDRLWASLSTAIKAEVKVPLASISLEMKSTADPKQVQKVERIKEKLAIQGATLSPDELVTAGRGLFFYFEGPTARLNERGQFWIATAQGESAVLLCGSSANCFGSAKIPAGESTTPVISPSADPIGSVYSLLDSPDRKSDPTLQTNLSYIWGMIVNHSRELTEFNSLPRTRGIAVFAGLQDSHKAQIRRSGYAEPINHVIVGSPLFVEQVE